MTTQKDQLKLTVICPVFNEAASLPIFIERFNTTRDRLVDRYDVELLFSNNSSTDGTLETILEFRKQYPYIFVATLSRNVGYQASLECGLKTAQGDLFIFIDVDCEDPPEMILDFITEYENGGFDIVYGERVDRDESVFLKGARRVFYRVLKAVADDDVILDMAEFSLITREVRDAIVQDKSSFPFIRASIGRVGFNRKGIAYKRQKRVAGRTNFNGIRLIYFATAGILSSSTLLLRLPVQTLFFWLVAVLALALMRVYNDSRWIDFALIALVTSYVGCSIAFIAIYVGRTYKNSLRRPNYFISEKHSNLQS